MLRRSGTARSPRRMPAVASSDGRVYHWRLASRTGYNTSSFMAKRALITGITGQDGSYLAELLLEQGYEVIGVVRRASAPNLWRIAHLLDRIELKPGDLLDQ